MNQEEPRLDPVQELFGVIDALKPASGDYSVCGGLAMAIYGFPRATKDIDVIFREDDLATAIERLESTGLYI